MEPMLSKQDKAMFYRHLDRTRVYFEYGSGGSTYQASIRPNIKKIYSVESDIEWQTKLKGDLGILASSRESLLVEQALPLLRQR